MLADYYRTLWLRRTDRRVDDAVQIQWVVPPLRRCEGGPSHPFEESDGSALRRAPPGGIAKADDTVVIVVNDHTRPGPNALIMKEIMSRLGKAGIRDIR